MTVQKVLKVVNDKVSSRESPLNEILMNSSGKSSADTKNANATDIPSTSQHRNYSSNFLKSTWDSDISDSEILPEIQTRNTISPISQLEEQDKVFLNRDKFYNNNTMQKEGQCAQQDNRENSVETDITSFLKDFSDFSKKGKRKEKDVKSTNNMSEINDNVIKVQEEISIKLDHLEVKLDYILRKLFPEEIKLKRPHGIPAFPLRTEKEWENLEEVLTDDDAFTYVMDVFAAKIKNQESEVAAMQSILPKIITNSFSRVISWRGTQKTKIAFNRSKIYEAIEAAILLKFGKSANLKKSEEIT